MAGCGTTLQVLVTLQRWPGALQLVTLLRRWQATRCYNNALDFVVLLGWPTTRRYYDIALDFAAVLRWSATRSCCSNALDLTTLLQCLAARYNSSVFVFFVFIFYSTVSKREQEQDREKRDRASKPVSRFCWLASSFLSTPSCQLPPSTSTPFSGSSNTSTLRQQQHTSTLR